MNWNNKVTELLGCKYPIIQGAFGGFGTSAIAAPVSAAGGFGIITGSALRTPQRLKDDIRKMRSMTDAPFGVNFSIGMCPNVEELREVAIEERVPVIFTSAFRANDHGRRIQEAGLKWIHKVASVQHAIAAEKQGADAVVIVGLEGTAFKSISQLPTLTSITTAARLIKIPLIAAGGIGDAPPNDDIGALFQSFHDAPATQVGIGRNGKRPGILQGDAFIHMHEGFPCRLELRQTPHEIVPFDAGNPGMQSQFTGDAFQSRSQRLRVQASGV